MITISNAYQGLKFQSNLDLINLIMQQTQKRLATGYKINNAGDNAAGLVLAKRLETQMRGLGMTTRNYTTADSMLKIAGSAVSSMTDTVIGIKELVVKALNSSSIDERLDLQNYARELITDFFNTQDSAKFGDKNIFEPSGTTGQTREFIFQIDDGTGKNSTLKVDMALNVGDFNIDFTDDESLRNSLKACDDTMNKLFYKNATFGSASNTMEGANDYQNLLYINLAESSSRILDADLAQEISTLAKNEIMFKATIALMQQSSKINSESALKLFEVKKNDWRCHI